MKTKLPALLLFLLTVAAGCDDDSSTEPGGLDLDFRPFDQVVSQSLGEQGLEGGVAVVVHRDMGIVHLQGYGSFDE